MNDELYNDALIALAKSTAGAGRLENPDGSSTCNNPLCGDRVTIDVKLKDGLITEIAHKTRGCILTKAAAALIVDKLAGHPSNGIPTYRDQIRNYLRGDLDTLPVGGGGVFEPVRSIKSRHDCVTIAFDALVDAVESAKVQS